MVAMARAGGGNHYYGDTAEDLMDPFQQELELIGNLCLRNLRIWASVPDDVGATMVNELPAVDGGWRLPDLAWGAEAWAVLRLTAPVTALPAAGGMLSVLRVSVQGQSLQGEAVLLQRSGLALSVLAPAAFAGVPADELVTRRLVELSAAEALRRMRKAANGDDREAVDRVLDEAGRKFVGNEWVSAMMGAMKGIAFSRSRQRMMKESGYSSGKLRNRLVAPDESESFSQAREWAEMPAFLRRNASQGKGDV